MPRGANSKPPAEPEQPPLDLIEVAPEALPVEEDSKAARFEALFAEERARKLAEENRYLRSTRKMRRRAARRAFQYLVGLSATVTVLLLLDGFRVRGFELPTTVLTTLAGGTFVSAIGLFGIVVKGLFPANSSPEKKGKKG
jgi:hypothetical protein